MTYFETGVHCCILAVLISTFFLSLMTCQFLIHAVCVVNCEPLYHTDLFNQVYMV